MFHAYAARFDVTENLEKFWKLNKADSCSVSINYFRTVSSALSNL